MKEKIETPLDWKYSEARAVPSSDFLLWKYKKKSSNGKFKASPFEALVFGKVFRLSGGEYGYCSLSKEKMAWELGCSYENVLDAYKNLQKDGYVFEVKHDKRDKNIDTKAYRVNIQKLYADNAEWLANGVSYEDDPNRKIRPRWERKRE